MPLNTPARDEIRQYFLAKVLADPRLQKYQNDLGVEVLGYEIDYIANQLLLSESSKLAEFYDPQSEAILLADLLYKLGYLKLQKPMKIQLDIKSGKYVYLEKYKRLTDGINVFLLDNDGSINANATKTFVATMGSKRSINATIDSGTLYYHIPLNTTYRKLYDFKVYCNGALINYSQALTNKNGDYSLEVDIGGNLSIVLKLNNPNGNNLSLNDAIQIDIFETTPSDTVPTNLAVIDDFDIVCENILKYSNYEQYMTIEEMQSILKYNKNIANTLVYNEDFKNFILANVTGISMIKVWQQQEEDLENGTLGCNINRVFVSFIEDGLKPRTTINQEIRQSVYDTVYGRYADIRLPDIVTPTITLNVTNNTKASIPILKQDQLKEHLSGYYDDVMRTLSLAIIYKESIKFLDDFNVDIELSIDGKTTAKNNTFYLVNTSNITVNVTERDYL